MRIAVAGFQHESHSFAPLPAGWNDFLRPGGWPAFQGPDTLLAAMRHTSTPIAGAIAALEAARAEPVPLTWCLANPSGPVTAEAFERATSRLLVALGDALDASPLDGLYLDLHGAMMAEAFPDAEGEVLRRVRALLGPDVPVAISLDPHANLTRAMAERADVLVPYRTYPHVDMRDTGARAADLLLERIRRGHPHALAYRQLDYWMPITAQCTLVEPMAGVMAERDRLAAAPGVAELGWCFGFPYADFADCGPAIACRADTQAQADAAADALLAHLRAHEPDFAAPVLPAAGGVAAAIRLALDAAGPIVLADTQDNPGGGGHGDTTGLLAELVRQGARGAVVAAITDPASAAACHAAGEGAELDLRIGGVSDGQPLAARARVLRLTDGRFTCTGPMMAGNPADLGASALVETGGVRALLVSRKMQAYDQALLRHAGVEPAAQAILVLKSSVHFRADFGPIAAAVLVVAAPGPVAADPATLPFRHIRPGVRLRPGANRGTS